MIIYHQRNIAAYAGQHIWYWPMQAFLIRWPPVSQTSETIIWTEVTVPSATWTEQTV